MPGLLGLSAPIIISLIITLPIAFTFHELSHAVTAVQLGDDTPRQMGRLTLNPLAHLDVMGSLLFIATGFGWAKPVQVNPYNLRMNPRSGMAVVAVAGPISNFLMALIAAIPFRLHLLRLPNSIGGPILPSLSGFLYLFISFNLLLMIFNLIPITPLDGSKILAGVAPHEWDGFLATLERWGPFLLLALVLLNYQFGVLSLLIGPAQTFLLRAIVGV